MKDASVCRDLHLTPSNHYLINIKNILTGKSHFEVTPFYSAEYIQSRLREKQLKKTWLSYGLTIENKSEEAFEATFKFGRGLKTTLNGKSANGKLHITCRPHNITFPFISFIILALLISGIYHLNMDTEKIIGITFLIFGIGIYVFFVILFQFIHRLSILRLLKIIDGGKVK